MPGLIKPLRTVVGSKIMKKEISEKKSKRLDKLRDTDGEKFEDLSELTNKFR